MLVHVVMWKLKDHVEGADKTTNADRMKELLNACANIVPGMLRLEVGVAQPGLAWKRLTTWSYSRSSSRKRRSRLISSSSSISSIRNMSHSSPS
jgi:hypothetical protein